MSCQTTLPKAPIIIGIAMTKPYELSAVSTHRRRLRPARRNSGNRAGIWLFGWLVGCLCRSQIGRCVYEARGGRGKVGTGWRWDWGWGRGLRAGRGCRIIALDQDGWGTACNRVTKPTSMTVPDRWHGISMTPASFKCPASATDRQDQAYTCEQEMPHETLNSIRQVPYFIHCSSGSQDNKLPQAIMQRAH